MRKKIDAHTRRRENLIIKLDECKYIGQYHNSEVYLMKDNKLARIYQYPDFCKKDYELLNFGEKSSYFPKVYKFCGHYIITEYIEGTNIIKYINEYGFDDNIALKLTKLIQYFFNSKVKSLDICLENIIINKNSELILIDFNWSPTSLLTFEKLLDSINKLGYLDKFLKTLKIQDSTLYNRLISDLE